MTKLVQKWVFGAAIVAMSTAAAAQQAPKKAADPANLLPGEPNAGSQTTAAPTPKGKPPLAPIVDRPLVGDIPEVSEEVVQGSFTEVVPWTIAGATELVAALEASGEEGLNPQDYHIDELKAAIAAGQGTALDEVASRNFKWLVEDIRDGFTPMDARKQWFVVDPDRDRHPTGDLLEKVAGGQDIESVLDEVRPTHPDYARLVKALNTTPKTQSDKRKLIRANLDRWRWLPRELGNQYLMTNVPEYQLRLTVNNKIISTYKTIVGKPGRTATPQLAETVEGVIFNPTWTVPQSIVKGEGLGAKVLNNPTWARSAGYKATRGENGYISVVQQPGAGNSLGLMKLDMPNPHAIFLHDTPSRGLFNQENRALSHGCIRTERARELAITLAILGNNATNDEERKAAAAEAVEISTSGKYTRVPIEKTMPVYITYFTMASDIDGKLATFKDIYDRDAPVLASLDQPRVANRARTTDEEVIEAVDDPRA